MFGILLLTFLTEIYLANVFFYGAAPGPGESVSTGPRVPGRTQRIFHQILVREFLFVFLLFLLTFDFWRELSDAVRFVFRLLHTFGDPVAVVDSF